LDHQSRPLCQFAEQLGRLIYEGIWVGENSPIPNTHGMRNDVIAALKELHVPVLRWPGGCFADEYHWRDGIGPRDKRPRRPNASWGGVDTNAFGTHEFLELCELLGAGVYINGNVGSGSPQEMMDWIEYMTSDADSDLANLHRRNGARQAVEDSYFAVGNETWGCGGNMRPEFYADVFRQYATFIKNHSGNHIQKLASVNLNVFHKHADRVRMANIAQMVNVLQSMILIDKEKMVLTPTYHVFRMYRVHQGATMIPVDLSAPEYKLSDASLPSLSASASRDAEDRLHLSLVNLDPNRAAEINANVWRAAIKTITGEVLTALAMNAMNTFDRPNDVKPAPFNGYKLEGSQLMLTIPAKSIVVLELK
jgi:alpha-L-arabinofuranosidase